MVTYQLDSTASRREEAPRKRRFAFVVEQTLGHVTYYQTLRTVIDGDPSVAGSWYPITYPFRSGGHARSGTRRGALAVGLEDTRREARRILGRVVAAHEYDAWTAWASARAWQALRHDRASSQYDALFFHTHPTTLLCAPLMRRVPAVISLDVTPAQYNTIGVGYGHQPSPAPVEHLKHALYMRTFRAARAFVAMSDWVRRSLIDDYGIDAARISVVPVGTDIGLWARPAPKRDEDPVRILFVGGDFARKGGEVLLQAFAAVRDRCELHLLTRDRVGQAPGVWMHRDIAPNSSALQQLYATADIFALPTLTDCSPIAIVEAMASGLPVVSSTVGGIPEIVRHGETGLLVPPGDVRALSAALSALIEDTARRRAMGSRGRSLAERNHDQATNVRRILDIMTNAADGDAGGARPRPGVGTVQRG